MKRRPHHTLLEHAVANAGIRKGMQGAQFAILWAVAVADEGELGPEGVHAAVRAYAEYWGDSERTAYRHLQSFRLSFPGHDTPAVIATQLAPQFVSLVAELHELSARRRRTAVGTTVATGFGLPVAALIV